MEQIRMVDLQAQYLELKEAIDAGMQEVIQQTAFINGPAVQQFSSELGGYCQVKHVIPCANGTDALQIAMMALDYERGSEIIVPAFAYISVVEMSALLGLVPVFVDVDPDYFTLDPGKIEAKITAKTVAIAPVHLFGQCADMESILAIASQYNLDVIEDDAQSIGSSYTFSDGTVKKSGTMGQVGITSFFPSKNLGCYGDGGALFTDADDLARKARMIANHGQPRKYEYAEVGINSRLDTIQAAVLRAKLPWLDNFCDRRRAVADRYDKAFSNYHDRLAVPQRRTRSRHVFHQYTLKIKSMDRDRFREQLKEKGIPTMVYYPGPMHLQKAFAYLNYQKGDFPVAEQLCEEVVSLPMHPNLPSEQQQYIINTVIELLKAVPSEQ